MAATTIKVSSDLRDRLNAQARKEGATVAQVIEELLSERDRAERFRQLKEDMTAMSAEELRDYMMQVSAWGSTLGDGMDSGEPAAG